MKQSITNEQLGELTSGQAIKLNDFWKGRIQDHPSYCQEHGLACYVPYYTVNETNHNEKLGDIKDYEERRKSKDKYYHIGLPLMNIGQMIEFLEEHEETHHYIDDSGYDHIIGNYDVAENKGFDLAWSGELCDALFSAVKEVLEK